MLLSSAKFSMNLLLPKTTPSREAGSCMRTSQRSVLICRNSTPSSFVLFFDLFDFVLLCGRIWVQIDVCWK